MLGLGLPGVCILALVAVVLYLTRQSGQLRAQIDAEHEKRLVDLRDNTRVILDLHDQVNRSLEILEKAIDHAQKS